MEYSIFTFPLEQAGWLLRQLSLSGAVGNLFAIIIYLLIGFIPAWIFLLLRKRGRLCKADIFLWALSGALLLVLYFMINPGLFAVAGLGSCNFLLCGLFYSMLTGYFVFRMLNCSVKEGLKGLQRSLRVFLYLMMVVFAGVIFAELFINLPESIRSVAEGNSAVLEGHYFAAVDLTATNVFLIFRSMVRVLPYGLGITILRFCIQALKELLADAYTEQAVAAVKKISVFCRTSLTAVVVAEIIVNIAQILCFYFLYQVDIQVTVPVFSILFMIAVHVMARYIEENQKLKLYNDLFI